MPFPPGPRLSFERDGYGVGLNDDEITTTTKSQEWIEVTFSVPTLINAFYFLDLFVAKDRSNLEIGQALVDGTKRLFCCRRPTLPVRVLAVS